MNITLCKQPRWRIEIEGRDPIETEYLTPVNLTMLGAAIADRVHNHGEEELRVAIALQGGADHQDLELIRSYVEKVHEHAVSKRGKEETA